MDPAVKLFVCIDNPVEGNYFHWSFYVHDATASGCSQHQVFDVRGEVDWIAGRQHYQTAVSTRDPAESSAHKTNILVGRLDREQLPTLIKAIKTVEADNETANWDCQDYVIEILDALGNAELIGGTPDYDQIKRKIKWMRGSVDLTRRRVEGYDPDDPWAATPETSDEESDAEEEQQPKTFQSDEFVGSEDDEEDDDR